MHSLEGKATPKIRAKIWGIRKAFILSDPPIADGAIVIQENKIIDLGETKKISTRYKNIPFLNASEYIVSPGLVNAHSHAAMGFFRDLAHGKKQMIEKFFFPLEKNLTADLVGSLSLSYLISGLKGGTTCFFDHYYFSDSVVKALERLGLRGVVGETIADIGGAFPSSQIFSQVKNKISKWSASSRIEPCLAPHASNTVSEKLLSEIASFARSEGLPLHFHLAQTQTEEDCIQKRAGMSAVALANKVGLLGENSLAVHLVRASDHDLDLIQASGTTVGFCPSSQILYEKLAPIEKIVTRKIPVTIGTDCAASNDGANIRSELKLAALLYHDRLANVGTSVGKDPIPDKNFFSMITKNPALVFGRNRFGSLAINKFADLVFWKKHIGLSPIHEAYTNFIFSGATDAAHHVLIDGKWVLWQGQLTTISESQVYEEYRKACRKIYQRLPKSIGRKVLDSTRY